MSSPSVIPAVDAEAAAQAPTQLEDLEGHVLDYSTEKARARAFVKDHPGVRWEVETDDGREEDAAQLAADHSSDKVLAQMDVHSNLTAKAPKAHASAANDGIHRGFQAMVDMDRAEDDAQKDAIARLTAKANAFGEGMERAAADDVAERRAVESQAGELLGAVINSAMGPGGVQAPEAQVQVAGAGIHRGFEAMVDMDRAEDDAQQDAIAKLDSEADAFNEDMERDSEDMSTGLSLA